MTSNNYTYQRPSDDEIQRKVSCFEEELKDFVRGLEYPHDVQVSFCCLDIRTTVIRVDRRLTQYRIFDNTEANECKEAALYAYWILKLRPIKIIDSKYVDQLGYNDLINELFAIHVLIAPLVRIGRIKLWNGKEGVKITLGHPFIKKLWYTFRYRSHSANSLIILAESITTQSFE